MKVIIAGSRGIKDYKIIAQAVDDSGLDVTEIISGGADGADKLGEQYGARNKIPVTIMQPDWRKHGKAAGIIRNTEMAKVADAAVVVILDHSKGSTHMASIMAKLNKPVYVAKFFTA